MKQIEAKIVADSISPQGHRITSFILTYPRFIHSELMTHRVFSRNSASSRAIPFEKMLKMVEEDPFIPIAWQKNHKGMQGNEYIVEKDDIQQCTQVWLKARDYAIKQATSLGNAEGFTKVTKQLCNRLLEPFMWHTTLCTFTESENFFELRCPLYQDDIVTVVDNKTTDVIAHQAKSKKEFKNTLPKNSMYTYAELTELDWLQINKGQAEIHMMVLAENIYDAMNESTPKELKAGEYHIPFGDKISDGELRDYFYNVENNPDPSFTAYQETKLKISTVRCARLSYMTFDGKIDYEKDIKLHDTLLESGHMSPFEHCARAMSDKEYYSFIKGEIPIIVQNNGEIVNRELYPQSYSKNLGTNFYGWCNNYKGFIQYRYLIENNYK